MDRNKQHLLGKEEGEHAGSQWQVVAALVLPLALDVVGVRVVRLAGGSTNLDATQQRRRYFRAVFGGCTRGTKYPLYARPIQSVPRT